MQQTGVSSCGKNGSRRSFMDQVWFRQAILPAFIVNPIDKFPEEWYIDIAGSCKESILFFILYTDMNYFIKERCE